MAEHLTKAKKKAPRPGSLFEGLKNIGLVSEDFKIAAHVRRAKPNRRPLTPSKKARLQG